MAGRTVDDERLRIFCLHEIVEAKGVGAIKEFVHVFILVVALGI